MPYEIKERGGRWHVINKNTGEDKGSSDTYKDALAHMRALYAVEDDDRDGERRRRR